MLKAPWHHLLEAIVDETDMEYLVQLILREDVHPSSSAFAS